MDLLQRNVRGSDSSKHSILSKADDVIEVIQQVPQVRIVLRHGLERLSKLLHLHVEKRRRRGAFVVHHGLVPAGDEVVHRVQGTRPLVRVHFAFGKVFEGGIALNFEAVRHLRFFGHVDFRYDDPILRILLLEAFIQLIPISSWICFVVHVVAAIRNHARTRARQRDNIIITNSSF